MTLPKSRIGDKGQRFELWTFGYPENGWSIIGWSDDRFRMTRWASSMLVAPGCLGVFVHDRTDADALDRVGINQATLHASTTVIEADE